MSKNIFKSDAVVNVLTIVAVLIIGWTVWQWFFCRFYVPPDHFAVVTAKSGSALPADRILAEDGEKGIRRKVLPEGRYFLNPIFYKYEIFRVTVVEPGNVGIVTSKVGKNLPSGQFLADDTQKGIRRKPLGPGKYRLNPYGYEVAVYTALNIPIGYVGVVTSLSGNRKANVAVEDSDSSKGVMKDVLQPGLYYINPKEFKVDVLEIGVNQVSIEGRERTHVGDMLMLAESADSDLPRASRKSRSRAKDKKPRRTAELYTKRRLRNVNSSSVGAKEQKQVADSRSNDYVGGIVGKISSSPQQAPMMATEPVKKLDVAQFVEFPSKDGFLIQLDMTVEFELLPENIASIYSRYGTLQEVVEKIVMPQILSVSRLKGSEYGAKDFIMGEARQQFQDDLALVLLETLKEKEIQIRSVLIRNVVVPDQILEPIKEASIAKEDNLTNIEKQQTARTRARLNTEVSMIDQKREQVEQETEKLCAEIGALKSKDVARIRAETDREVAKIRQEIARIRAEIHKKMGKARADATELTGKAHADGFRLRVKAFGADSMALALNDMTSALNPHMEVTVFHAGDGTLWTDLEGFEAGGLGGMQVMKKRN